MAKKQLFFKGFETYTTKKKLPKNENLNLFFFLLVIIQSGKEPPDTILLNYCRDILEAPVCLDKDTVTDCGTSAQS